LVHSFWKWLIDLQKINAGLDPTMWTVWHTIHCAFYIHHIWK
jgi:hypothetical protein